MLSHMKALQYLDYRLVDKAHVQAAREQYQDQMMELEDKDAKKEEEELQAKKNAENDALMAVGSPIRSAQPARPSAGDARRRHASAASAGRVG